MKKEEFIEYLGKKDISISEYQLKQFEQYANLLIEYNEKINLTAIVELEDIFEKHFYDSILPSLSTPMDGSLCDVGSGAGFPSIPLKIIYPNLDVTIIEPLQKRVRFLEVLCQELQLDVTILNERAEDVKELRESFDIVTARAVANLPVLSELCIPLVKIGGLFLAMKGSSGLEEAKQAQQAIKKLGCTLERSEEEELLDGSKRINLYYRKVKKTDSIYPRMYAKIKKNPL